MPRSEETALAKGASCRQFCPWHVTLLPWDLPSGKDVNLSSCNRGFVSDMLAVGVCVREYVQEEEQREKEREGTPRILRVQSNYYTMATRTPIACCLILASPSFGLHHVRQLRGRAGPFWTVWVHGALRGREDAHVLAVGTGPRGNKRQPGGKRDASPHLCTIRVAGCRDRSGRGASHVRDQSQVAGIRAASARCIVKGTNSRPYRYSSRYSLILIGSSVHQGTHCHVPGREKYYSAVLIKTWYTRLYLNSESYRRARLLHLFLPTPAPCFKKNPEKTNCQNQITKRWKTKRNHAKYASID